MAVATITNELIAIRLFGWKWMAFIGRPVRGEARRTPEPEMVRQFMSPKSIVNERWQACFAEHEGHEATGDEPLAYCYCSSSGPEWYPDFLGIDDYWILKLARKHWKKTCPDLWRTFVANLPASEKYQLGDYCRAAIKSLDETLDKPEPLPMPKERD